MSNNVHLALRISDDMYGLPSPVLRHNSIAFARNAVWFGKPNTALPARLVDQLNTQIAEGSQTYVFIIDPNPMNPVAYQSELFAVSLRPPKEKDLIPRFYKESKILSRMRAWLKVGYLDAFRLDEFAALHEANNAYTRLEKKWIRIGVKNLPGYFQMVEQ